jgi:hypothetical protein
VDLSAFHATQGRRIVDTSITPAACGGFIGVMKFCRIFADVWNIP